MIRGFIDWWHYGPREFRRPNAPKGDGNATCWKRGDLAGCSVPGRWYDMATGIENIGPKFGDIDRVAEVAMHNGWQMLRFEAWPEQQFTACDFRKVVPVQDEACTAAFKRQMKDCRPKVGA